MVIIFMMKVDFVPIHELLIKRDSSIEFSREKTDIPGVAMLVSEFLGCIFLRVLNCRATPAIQKLENRFIKRNMQGENRKKSNHRVFSLPKLKTV